LGTPAPDGKRALRNDGVVRLGPRVCLAGGRGVDKLVTGCQGGEVCCGQRIAS